MHCHRLILCEINETYQLEEYRIIKKYNMECLPSEQPCQEQVLQQSAPLYNAQLCLKFYKYIFKIVKCKLIINILQEVTKY